MIRTSLSPTVKCSDILMNYLYVALLHALGLGNKDSEPEFEVYEKYNSCIHRFASDYKLQER